MTTCKNLQWEAGRQDLPEKTNLQPWQDLTRNTVQIYCLLKPSFQTSFMSDFGHFIRLSVLRLLLNTLVSNALNFLDLHIQLWLKIRHQESMKEKNVTFNRHCNFLCLLLQGIVYKGPCHLFLARRPKWISWPSPNLIPSLNQQLIFYTRPDAAHLIRYCSKMGRLHLPLGRSAARARERLKVILLRFLIHRC